MIRHFTASAVVLDGERVLLVHHRKSGLWLYPGGHIDSNESPDEAAIREVREETGVEAAVLGAPRFVHSAVQSHPAPWAIIEKEIVDPANGPHRHIDILFVCRAVGGRLAAQLDEVADARWVPISGIAELAIPAELPALITAAARWAAPHCHEPVIR